jgi:hypothetical protein
MTSVTAYIRTTKKKADKVNLRFRVCTGRALQLFHKSDIEVPAAAWDGVRQEIKAKVVFDTAERLRINREVVERKNLLLELFEGFSGDVPPTSGWLEEQVDRCLNPEKIRP